MEPRKGDALARRARQGAARGTEEVAQPRLEQRILPRTPEEGRRRLARGREVARRPRQPAVLHQGRLPRRLSAEDELRRPEGPPGVPHVLRLHRHAGGHGLHQGRPRPVGRVHGALLRDGGAGEGRRVPDHPHLRPLQRRLRLLPRRAQGRALHGARLFRQHRAPDPPDEGLQVQGLRIRRLLRAARASATSPTSRSASSAPRHSRTRPAGASRAASASSASTSTG